ncbi:hypothetical protein Q7471_08910 [Glaesserella parasuis]|nr:hypothetical protein [Glaesserella parasuis]MDP0094854.1 hypothetical protein [Glaesserella parasuis]
MSESKYTLPPREWYSLEQAVKRIQQLTGETIEIEELIHYWLIGKLNIAINIFFSNSRLNYIFNGNTHILEELNANEMIIGNKIIELDKINHYTYQQENNLENRKFFKDSNFILSYFEFDNLLEKTEKMKCFKALKGFFFDDYYNDVNCLITTAKGLFYLNYHGNSNVYSENFYRIEKTFKKTNKIPYDFISSLFQVDNETDKNISILLSFKEESYIDLDELYITNESLENFLKDKEQPKPPKIGTKTLNTQAEFIRNLITIHYGEDIANNIRNQLDDPNSDISKDFDNKALKAPSGKTVDRWINRPYPKFCVNTHFNLTVIV